MQTQSPAQQNIVWVPVGELNPAPYNPRKWSEKATEDLKESILRFGLVDPIIVNKAENRANVIIGGHFRLHVAKLLGFKQVPVLYVNIPDEARERELNLRLNKNLGDWDFELLKGFEEDMLLDVGFESEEVDELFGQEVQEDDFNAQEEYAKIEEAETKPGDLYELGKHRLLCGDATKREDVARLMGAEKADMVFTDPPYNVNYDYTAKYDGFGRGRKKNRGVMRQVFNDNRKPAEFYRFLLAAFLLVYAFSKDTMALYVCHATKTQGEFFRALKNAGFHFSQTIIWLKERIILALGQDYHRIYEPIWFGWKQGKSHYKNKRIATEKEVWDLDRLSFEERLDVWYVNRDKSAEYEHPTQKPVRLPERAIHKNCPRGGLLYEPFAGSGSTMMAAEQLGRRAYLMELDPKYCDVIVKRWERYTNKKAKLLNNARSEQI